MTVHSVPIHAEEDTLAPATRPRSAVSHGVGIVGVLGLFGYLLFARHAETVLGWVGIDIAGRGPLSGPSSAIASVLACAIPMMLWSVLVDRVHRNPSTGIDWSRRAVPADRFDVSMTKLVGLWATWAVIAFAYFILRYYWAGNYRFAMDLFKALIVPLVVLSVPYVVWLDRKLIDPRDGAYAFGQILTGQGHLADRRMVAHHWRAWVVKAFFTAFMVSIVPGNFASLVSVSMADVLASPVSVAVWTINLLFLIDVHLATVGYILTMKPLDAHIRTANPYALGWIAALACYPPFLLMDGGPLDYRVAAPGWEFWLGGHPVLLGLWGAMLAVLAGCYAWATMAFGLRFSNLTHRGVITHGPYAITRHPAYVSKNIMWWLSHLPFLVTGASWVDGLRNTVLIAAVSGIYYLRAKTEEKHLLADPAYRAYWNWAEAHAPIPRLFRRLTGRSRPVVVFEPDPRVGPVA